MENVFEHRVRGTIQSLYLWINNSESCVMIRFQFRTLARIERGARAGCSLVSFSDRCAHWYEQGYANHKERLNSQEGR